jgi:GNAT superfamily N-acetyltransferase
MGRVVGVSGPAPSPLVVRRADEDDVDAILTLVESAYRGESSRAGWTTEADLLDGRRTDTEAVRAMVTGDTSMMLVAERASRGPVACCQLESRAGGVAYFGAFAVVPALQGGGVGGALLDAAERTAVQTWGVTTMEMTVIAQREDLIAWYLRRGYRRTGETRPFPYGDERFGLPRRDDLVFAVLTKPLVG